MNEQQGFRTVLRGYDPTEVDRRIDDARRALEQARAEAADRTVEVAQLQASHERLGDDVRAHKARIAALEDEAKKVGTPTFEGLGDRIGAMLALADEEATALRESATAAADQLRDEATSTYEQLRLAAEQYAQETRSTADTEAARIVEKARQQADAIIDHADREATARREEGEAFFENQRAKASAAAADFEATLGHRREKAAADFAALMEEQQRTLGDAQARSSALLSDAEADRRKAREESEGLLTRARAEADEVVTTAREQADRTRRDSDRELAAVTAQRDAITAQLGNVRTMLATVGGGSLVGGSLMAAAMDDPEPRGEQESVAADAAEHRGEDDSDGRDAVAEGHVTDGDEAAAASADEGSVPDDVREAEESLQG